ncbi:hypothetical protein PCANC_23403 [Puccinia coronata f. sp. avenae]|uniref:Protein OS-9 homolog n=1 Tax=Puccinia coronata f. sp. avenae TaxID=200324 RepID=A0A2N5TQV0_9BASI|nr:hypothetical protein PCASD_18085 [Puccinia coronata f. sp. avenae]PLW27867.1 hypothetical protein PCANC_23403 [Puccinia coronata f. sp. avenae]PLW38577.1 hypothetical protein PCASD_10779 [Puccinia coronata f. sp. avenae]
MSTRLCLVVLCLSRHVSSLSSHSPPDPLAYPKYSVSLSGWDHAINNLTATAILNNLQSESSDQDISLSNYNSLHQKEDQAELRHTLMRTASGQAFLCALPPIPSLASSKQSPQAQTAVPDLPSPETEDLERKSERQKIEQEGLENGLKLISSLKDRCIYTRLGWFTYSFCYGKGEIKQFHAIMVPGYNHPQEDPEQDVYILGFHLDHPQNPHYQARLEGTLPAPSVSAGEGELTSLGRNRFASGGASILGSISDVLRDESVIKSSMEIEEEEFQQKRYLVQRWDGGTICDMTGKPRSVEVQFHCSTLGSDHIALLRETSLCEYLLVIHTPRLCSEPLFLDGGSRKGLGAGEMVANIGCRPVLTNEEIEKWKASEEARKVKEEQEKLQAPKEIAEQSTVTENPSPDDLNKPASPEGPVAKDDSTDVPSGEAKADNSPENNEPAPGSVPDQTVLSENSDQATTDKPDSDSQGTSEKSDNKPEELEIDPITVYFDADTGKIYMDKTAADEARQGRSGGKSKTQESKSDGKADKKGSSSSEQTGKSSGDELEEIAKALKDSLGALLRDLRGGGGGGGDDDARRRTQNRAARPKSLADVLASLGAKPVKLAHSHKLKKPADRAPPPPAQSQEQIKKLASESHSRLVEQYQQTFQLHSSRPKASDPPEDQAGKEDEE